MKGEEKMKNFSAKSIAVMLVIMSLFTFAVSAAETATEIQSVSYSDFATIITNLQNQISVTTIVGILATLASVCVGLVFLWWAVRKVVSALMSAFRNGKLSI